LGTIRSAVVPAVCKNRAFMARFFFAYLRGTLHGFAALSALVQQKIGL
jgi:hypothetical protein